MAVDPTATASSGASEGAMSLVSEPYLFAYAPAIPALTRTITEANPGAIASHANTAANLAQTLGEHAKELKATADQTKPWWRGDAALASWDATFTVSMAVLDHGNEKYKYARDALKLGNDLRRLITFVNDGQRMANGVVATLSHIPYVGHALAEAYALKTFVWTGLCAAQLVNIGQDVANLVQDLKTDSVQKAYTPPTSITPAKTTA
jgi:hypothetical protein